MRADLSLCISTRGEPSLEQAVASVRPHVGEVCIVYTGYDGSRVAALEKLADRFAICTECNDLRGEIADFSVARNASFALATKPWIAWMDADDVIVGAEHLHEVLACAHAHEHPRLLAPYDYSTDEQTGEVTCQQWRERIVRNDGHYRWENPVHETLVAVDGRNEDYHIEQPVRWVHRRKGVEEGRNLRILQAYGESHAVADNAWWHLNYATEQARAGDHRLAVEHFKRYISLSEWDDERALAMLRLSQSYQALDTDFRHGDDAMWWARQAHELRPDAFEPLFALAKLYTVYGMFKGDDSAIRDANRFAKLAVETPRVHTPLAVNPYERDYKVHDIIRTNAEMLEDWQTAHDACSAGLAARPADGAMRLAQRRYAAALKLDRVAASVSCALEILIVCGDTHEPWNPAIAERTGIGGSETAVIAIAQRLAERGHRVRVFCNCQQAGLYGDVEYTNDLTGVTEAQVLIAWRDAALLEGIPAQVKLVWAHDVGIHSASRWTLHLADRVIAVSEWHKAELVRRHGETCGLSPGKIVVLRNGIDPERFPEVGIARNPHRAIYSSSPERGLDQLIDMWPSIRAEVPDAELHVFYGGKLLAMAAPGWGKAIEEKIQRTAGVFDRGRVNQSVLASEMMSAGVWLFPSWHYAGKAWTETSCISAMEAQAAGLHIVTSPHGALVETVRIGAFVEGDATSPEYQSRFVQLAVERMGWTDDEHRARIRAEALRAFGWDDVAAEWDALIREMAGKAVAA